MTGIVASLQNLVNSILSVITGLVNTVLSALQGVLSVIVSFLGGVVDFARGLVELLLGHIVLIGMIAVGIVAFSAYRQRRGGTSVGRKKAL